MAADNYWIIVGETGSLVNSCDANSFILGDSNMKHFSPTFSEPERMKYVTHLRPCRQPGCPSSSLLLRTTPRRASVPRRSPSQSHRWPPLVVRLTRSRLILKRKKRRRRNMTVTDARSCFDNKDLSIGILFSWKVGGNVKRQSGHCDCN